MSKYTLQLAGQSVTLQPTVGTLRGLSHLYPSLYDLSMRVAQFNLVAICDVIQVAAGGDDGKDREVLEQAVFDYGVQKISPIIVDFVSSLFNGGREPVSKSNTNAETDAKN